MKTLIVFATHEEAQPTIDLLAAQPFTCSIPWFYEWEKGFLVVSGIGSFSTFVSLNAISQSIDTIFNFGLAGALNRSLELGTLLPVSRCSKLLWHPGGAEAAKMTASYDACPELAFEAEQEISLVSSDFPVYGTLSQPFDLVDMEGYAVAFFAKKQEKPCQLYKVVSDYCDASSSTLIKQGLKKHAEAIAQFIDSFTGSTLHSL
jgi:adenosylhomocysteine nucleosidase